MKLAGIALAASMLLPGLAYADAPANGACPSIEGQILGTTWSQRSAALARLLQRCGGAFVPRSPRQPSPTVANAVYGGAGKGDGGFGDLGDYGWAQAAIGRLARRGIFQGVAPGVFDPAGHLTRAQTATLITRLFGLKPPAQPVTFVDVPPSFWAYNAIEAAAPYMTEFQVPAGTAFEPQQDTTRVELAASLGALEIALGHAQLPTQSAAQAVWNGFTDGAQVPAGLQQTAAIAVQLGFMKGYPDGTFRPENDITRAEAAVLLDRVLGSSETIGQSYPPLQPAASAPQVTGVSPVSAQPGATVTISGSGFTGADAVEFGAAAASFQVVGDTEILATVPPGSGSVDVTVVGPAGTSAPSAADLFTYATSCETVSGFTYCP